MRVRQNIVVLQASEDDAGGDADLLGEGDDVGAREGPPLDERLQCGRRNELVAREDVRFFLFLFPVDPLEFNEYVSAAMLEDVPGLVEEGEPEVIVALVAKAELNDGIVADPARGAADAALRQLRHKEHDDSGGGAQLLQTRYEVFRLLQRQAAYLIERLLKTCAVEGRAGNFLRENLTPSKPCGEGFLGKLEALRLPVGYLVSAEDRLPLIGGGYSEEAQKRLHLIRLILVLGEPSEIGHLLDEKPLEPCYAGFHPLPFGEAGLVVLVLAFEVAPEVRWSPDHLLQLPGGLRSDLRLSLDDLVDGLFGEPRSVGKLRLRHVEVLQILQEHLSRRCQVIGAVLVCARATHECSPPPEL